MLKSKTIIICDVCFERDIKYKDYYNGLSIETHISSDQGSISKGDKYKHVCHGCYDKITGFICSLKTNKEEAGKDE